MRKSRRLSLLFILLLVAILGSSCAKRRLDQLEANRVKKLNENIDSRLVTETFYPDKIVDFSLEDYLKWYKNLKAPANLQLPAYENPKNLKKTEMVNDFEYLFRELKENYPFFEVLKRKYDIDFLKNHDIYLKKVRECESDEEFIQTLSEIMKDLNNYHARIADKDYVKSTLAYYSKNWNQPSIYYEFLNLNRQVVRNRYQLDGVQSQNSSYRLERKQADVLKKSDKSNLTFESQDDLAIIKIKQMVDQKGYEEEEKILDEFLKNKHMYKALVIDIRSNAGGNMEYWRNFLLPKLITSQKQVTNHMFFKDSEKTRLLLADDTLNAEKLSNVDITGISLDHAEDLRDFAYYIKDVVNINPDESDKNNGYQGKIYLLVDKDVFSAAEGFASFMKNTGTATIIGSQTGGDGITLGVINSVLPNSGLVFTYTNALGYGPDGKINEEFPTTPDINSKSYRESLDIIKDNIDK